MKRVEAYIQVGKLDAVKQALDSAGIQGMTCEQVRGYGHQMGRTEQFQGVRPAVNLLPKMRVMVVVKDSDLALTIDTIVEAARSGEIGDGKIFVTEILEAIRIRTGERGDAALS